MGALEMLMVATVAANDGAGFATPQAAQTAQAKASMALRLRRKAMRMDPHASGWDDSIVPRMYTDTAGPRSAFGLAVQRRAVCVGGICRVMPVIASNSAYFSGATGPMANGSGPHASE